MDLSAIAAVLFDMDGTLVDSDAAVERAWTTWAHEHGADPGETIAGAHGSPAENTVRRMLPHLDEAGVRRAADRQLELQYTDVSDVVALPGAAELLADLDARGVPWTIVTSADRRLAKARLDAAGLPLPASAVTVEEISAGKPDPEGFLLGAQRLGVPPERCLVVEDSAPGIAAGRAAGAVVASLRGLPADVVLGSLRDLVGRVGEE
ncbi:sugar-phosphatase [Pseudonocardia thermophila]|uniref:Sugar-phosphatase n=1 Tax=Pseudonocardia thermophila TaxID=1848 RepID=A0A1M6UI55_PSETH|nr:HAD-IA family hydrolase [Pseudonocardia thermophila]SHK68924.1 sugar-phosphatase [Pseudonocardia thermophila]